MKRPRIFLAAGLLVPLAAVAAYACGGSDGGGPGDGSPDAAGDTAALSDGSSDGGTEGSTTQCADRNPLKNPYFGDLHAHTSYSFDAFTFQTRNTPFDAYAFAKGMTVSVAAAGGAGLTTTIERPLDFLAVTDHSEWLALTYGCGDTLDGGPQGLPQAPYYGSIQCTNFRSTVPAEEARNFAQGALIQSRICDGGYDCAPVIQDAWKSEQAAAAAANEPCKFTSLIAYEWTHAADVMDAGSATLHKNVVFGTDKVPLQPVDSFTHKTQTELWTGLDQACLAAEGCQAITIPHNSNLSQGAAFEIPPGSESQMVKYQRLVEIFQHKGGSECFYDPANPADPTCNFEYLGGITEPNLPKSYVRTALKDGLATYAATKTNPLQMGIVAATDDHNGAPGNTRETTFPGHAGRLDDTPALRIGVRDGGVDPGVSHGHNPGGLAVTWAEQNTRDSIFAALMRRETYGTSGTRIVVRFYQTWNTTDDPCADSTFPAQLVASGAVPMGGSIPTAPAGATSPRLVAYAWKDQTDLARIDIVKGWVDAQGVVQERVTPFPVTAGKAACFTMTDTEFTGTATFYYARVLEQPTPRWSVQDCKTDPTLNPACAAGGYLNTNIQERAWTSPIWFLP